MRAAGWVCVAVLVAGCPRVAEVVEAPRVDVLGVEVGEELRVELQVRNANREALTVAAVDWELAADERAIVRGRVDDVNVVVPGRGSATTTLRAKLSAAQRERVLVAPGELSVAGTAHAGRTSATFWAVVAGAARIAASAASSGGR